MSQRVGMLLHKGPGTCFDVYLNVIIYLCISKFYFNIAGNDDDDKHKEEEQQLRLLEGNPNSGDDHQQHQEQQQHEQVDTGKEEEIPHNVEGNDLKYENINNDNADEVVIYSREYTASFERFGIGAAKFKFLKNFKSPCWLEDSLG